MQAKLELGRRVVDTCASAGRVPTRAARTPLVVPRKRKRSRFSLPNTGQTVLDHLPHVATPASYAKRV